MKAVRLNISGKIEEYSLLAGSNIESADTEPTDFQIILWVRKETNMGLTAPDEEGGYGEGIGPCKLDNIIAKFLFSDDLHTPEPRIEVLSSYDNSSFDVSLWAYLPTRFVGTYLDILRNESPLYVKANCEISEEMAEYLDSDMNILRETDITLTNRSKKMSEVVKPAIFITSDDEPVGEGESRTSITINQ
jgi:hypothetical protein